MLMLLITLAMNSCAKPTIPLLNKSEFNWKTDNEYFSNNKNFVREEKIDNDGTLYNYIGEKDLGDMHFSSIGIALTKNSIPEAITLFGPLTDLNKIKEKIGKVDKELACEDFKVSQWNTRPDEEIILITNKDENDYRLYMFNASLKKEYSRGVLENYSKMMSELKKGCTKK